MSEVPKHSYHDSESSESEKDLIDANFELIIGNLRIVREGLFEYSSETIKNMVYNIVDKYEPVIDTLEQAQKKFNEFPEYLSVKYDLCEIKILLQE